MHGNWVQNHYKQVLVLPSAVLALLRADHEIYPGMWVHSANMPLYGLVQGSYI